MSRHISRRTLSRGAAWSIPAAMTVGVAPALASSTTGGLTLVSNLAVGDGLNSDGSCAGYNVLRVSEPGLTIGNTTTASVITSARIVVSIPLAMPSDPAMWTNYGDSSWSLAPVTEQVLISGVTYEQYTFSWTGPINGTEPSTTLPRLDFATTSYYLADSNFYVSMQVVADGQTLSSSGSSPQPISRPAFDCSSS